MSSDAKKFIKGVTTGYAFTIVSMFVSLWMVPFTLKYLTKPEYGVFAIITDLLGWLSIANLGITSTFNSKGAQLLGSKSYDELNVVLSTTFYSQLFSAIILVVFGIYLVYNPNLLFGNVGNLDNIGIVVGMTVLSFIISYVMQPLNILLIADKQLHVDNYLKFGLLLLRTTLTILFLINGYKLVSIAFSNMISTLVIAFVTWYRAYKTLPFIRLDFGLWQKKVFDFLLKNGIWFTIGGIAGLLIFRMDNYLIGKYISLAVVANFTITSKLYQIASTFHQQFFNTTRPYFAQVFGKGDLKTLEKMYNLTFYSSFLFAFISGVIIFLINKWFIGWWVGENYFLGQTINFILAINFIIQSAVLPNRILLATTFYKNSLHSLTRILEGITKYLTSLIFIQPFGLIVILLTSILSSLAFSNIFLNILTSQFFKQKFYSKMFFILFLFLISFTLLINSAIGKIIFLSFTLIALILYSYKMSKKDLNLLKPIYDKIRNKLY